MPSPRKSRLALVIGGGWVLVALLLAWGPAPLRERVLVAGQDAVASALHTVPLSPGPPTVRADEPQDAARQATLEQLAAVNRALLGKVAQLRAENDRLRTAGGIELERAEPLLETSLVSTRVVGLQGEAHRGTSRLLLALGRNAGLTGEELVLTGNGVTIEHGLDLGLRPDDLVSAGRSLFGRTTRVGERSSLVQPLTDAEFRIAARIVRNSPLGPVEGPVGILSGTGHSCRLLEVPATEAVAVGDAVFTEARASPTGVPIYCGRVTRVDVASSAEHWTIDVSPLANMTNCPPEVEVLRSTLRGDESQR